MPEILIANAAGQVTGTHSVVARIAPVRGLIAAARGNLIWVAGGVALLTAIAFLETFDNDEVNESIKEWSDAARMLGADQFGAALEEVIPSSDEWDFDDRDAFEVFIRKLKAEINSLAEACAANKDALTSARDAFNDAVDALIDVLTGILIAVIASIALQAFPPTAPLAQAIGIAGLTAAIAVVTLIFADLGTLFSAVGSAFRANDQFAFVSDSRPGWAAVGSDPGIKDIKIDWVKDSKFYQ